MEEHTICNMKCTYCSEEYYGGNKPSYNVERFLNDLNKVGLTRRIKTIVWGGGEPTAGKHFDKFLKFFKDKAPNAWHRIVTNSVLYSDQVEELLKIGKIQLTTSVDAGTAKTFSKIRGFRQSGFDKVLKNIKRYSDVSKEPITIKYLFSLENSKLDEINSFLENIAYYDLARCIFQISINFKFEVINEELLRSILMLYGGLHKLKVNAVFIDEIILQRFSEMNAKNLNAIVSEAESTLHHTFYYRPNSVDKIAIWGASINAARIIKQSITFKNHMPVCIFDSDKQKHSSVMGGLQVTSFDPRKHSDMKILICSVQGYAGVLEQLDKSGFKKENVIKELVL